MTETLAAQIGKVARSLQQRESVELADAKSRKEVNVAQRKNLRIARFLNRIVFCLFAEYTGLLPKNLFTDILKSSLDDPAHFVETTEALFKTMRKGGLFGKDRIRHFNGHLFDDFTVFQLTEAEIKDLADAAEADWQFIQPSIMGTLFQRALDENQRAQLGAHYTSEADIRDLVEPVLLAPLRREWAALKSELVGADVRRLKPPAKSPRNTLEPPHIGSYQAKLAAFLKKLRTITVLDPACGSGNFLYVSLQMLLDLEKEVINFAAQLGFQYDLEVGVQQLRAIEINPYAFELAQVSVQIGWLQWRRDNGFDNDRTPVLQNLDGFQNEDALLVSHFHGKAKTLKEAQAGEHTGDDALKFYTEREWPAADVIVSNPPFLGGSKLWEELGRHYQKQLWGIYDGRVPGFADLCCYWFEKARQQIENGKCKRAGLLATQGIRGGANREVLKRIKETGDIFFAASDRDWILDGASVHVSMVSFDDGSEKERTLDGKSVTTINANLSATTADITTAARLSQNLGVGFMGSSKKAPFDISENLALEMAAEPTPSGSPNSDVIRPGVNGQDIARRWSGFWIIDFPPGTPLEEAANYAAPFNYVETIVKPEREKNKRAAYRERWWIHAEPRPEMRSRLAACEHFIVTPTVSKHRIFGWQKHPFLPDQQLIAFARDDDYFFGILHSRFHEAWSLAQGTQVRERESGFRYTPTSCFETYPFPFPDDLAEPMDNLEARLDAAKFYKHITLHDEPAAYGTANSADAGPESAEDHREAIATAAKELNALRERWLNPPEWTVEKILQFPGSTGGPWQRYLDPKTVDAKTGLGTVKYPRLEPRDAECAAKLKDRTLTKLYNERPAWLDLAHKKLDAAVAAAYGWPPDLTEEVILEKLLALNLARAAEEAKATNAKQPKAQRPKHAEELL